jgi:hypothetical protein
LLAAVDLLHHFAAATSFDFSLSAVW